MYPKKQILGYLTSREEIPSSLHCPNFHPHFHEQKRAKVNKVYKANRKSAPTAIKPAASTPDAPAVTMGTGGVVAVVGLITLPVPVAVPLVKVGVVVLVLPGRVELLPPKADDEGKGGVDLEETEEDEGRGMRIVDVSDSVLWMVVVLRVDVGSGGQTVVVVMTSDVTWPMGQLVTAGAHEVMVYVLVVVRVEVTDCSGALVVAAPVGVVRVPMRVLVLVEPVSVVVTGQTVVVVTTSDVTWPMGQLVTVGAHEVMVYVLVVVRVEVTDCSGSLVVAVPVGVRVPMGVIVEEPAAVLVAVPVAVVVTGQMVVVVITSDVTWPSEQLVTVGAQEVTV